MAGSTNIGVELGGATERSVPSEGTNEGRLPGTPHRLAQEAHGVAAEFNAGDKVCRLRLLWGFLLLVLPSAA